MSNKEKSADLLKVEIVTPESIFYLKNAYMVTIPGVNGELGVLSGHMSLLTGLRPGLVTVYDKNMEIIDYIFIADGFAEINSLSLIMFVQEACFISNQNATELAIKIKNLQEDLELAKTEEDRIIIEKQISSNQVLLDIIKILFINKN